MPPFPPCQAALILSLQVVGSLYFSFKFRRMMEIEDHVEFHRLFTQSSSALWRGKILTSSEKSRP
jgi:hypothetical protein